MQANQGHLKNKKQNKRLYVISEHRSENGKFCKLCACRNYQPCPNEGSLDFPDQTKTIIIKKTNKEIYSGLFTIQGVKY